MPVKFASTKIQGAALIEIECKEDERGSFARVFDERAFKEAGYPLHIVQSNINFNAHAGTLRGLHYQAAPHAETKLVRVVVGAVYDVMLDLRPDSPSYKRWEGFELSAKNGLALYIPEGCAHGFQTLVDNTEVFYEMGNYYHPDAGCGIRWNDPAFAISWPEAKVRTISKKDSSYPDWKP